MTNYLVTCVIEGDNNISKEIIANSPKEAIDKIAVQHGKTDLFVFEDGYKVEFVKTNKIVKFIVINLDEKKEVDEEQARKNLEALKSFNF